MRICFDLDLTIFNSPKVEYDYSTCTPIEKMVSLLRKLKKNGNTIIICTARGMNPRWKNKGIDPNVYKDTIESLEKFNIPYDEIYFGKPYADFYVDDKAINPYLEGNIDEFVKKVNNE